jgi:hypothetical protein
VAEYHQDSDADDRDGGNEHQTFAILAPGLSFARSFRTGKKDAPVL